MVSASDAQETFLDEDPSEEDESDATSTETAAVLADASWTVETLVGQLKRGNIDLSPSFQRREAWTLTKKSRFIESLFIGLPIPQIVLAQQRDRKGKFIVIDGKQRLLSLRQFVASEEDDFKGFKLSGLQTLISLNGYSYSDLLNNEEMDDLRDGFDNQTIRTVVLKSWPDYDYLFKVFLRLNGTGVPLSPQELRQALHPGGFVSYVDRYAGDSTQLQRILGTSGPDFRMRDTELLVRFCAYVGRITEYRGNLKKFLDDTCKYYNDEWERDDKLVSELIARSGPAIDTTYDVFATDAFRRWNMNHFERRFNRAVFDVMTYYFADAAIATAAREHKEDVLRRFKDLCRANPLFNESLQTSTKTMEANATRLGVWGEALTEITNVQVVIPKLQGNKLLVE